MRILSLNVRPSLKREGARTFLSALRWRGSQLTDTLVPVEPPGVAADENLRAPMHHATSVRGTGKPGFCLALCLAARLGAQEANWPEFRGPEGNGIAGSTNLPLHWGEHQQVKWRTPIHDRGWSSPVIWGR